MGDFDFVEIHLCKLFVILFNIDSDNAARRSCVQYEGFIWPHEGCTPRI